MKKRIFMMSLFLCILTLNACGKSNVKDVEKSISVSHSYTEEEIRDAMDIVMNYFHDNFEGCTLKELRYDEIFSDDIKREWIDENHADAIVLLSSFQVDENGGDGSMEPNQVYDNWEWILVKNDHSDWELETYGY